MHAPAEVLSWGIHIVLRVKGGAQTPSAGHGPLAAAAGAALGVLPQLPAAAGLVQAASAWMPPVRATALAHSPTRRLMTWLAAYSGWPLSLAHLRLPQVGGWWEISGAQDHATDASWLLAERVPVRASAPRRLRRRWGCKEHWGRRCGPVWGGHGGNAGRRAWGRVPLQPCMHVTSPQLAALLQSKSWLLLMQAQLGRWPGRWRLSPPADLHSASRNDTLAHLVS